MTTSALLQPTEDAPRESSPVRRRILAESTRMFAERGFAQVTIREIAAAAGVEAPTIYHYFGDKRSLYRTACVTCFIGRAERYNGVWRSPQGAAERILGFTQLLCEVLSEDDVFRRLLQRELIDHDPETMAELVRTSFQDHYMHLLELVREVSGSPIAEQLTFSIFALAFGFTQLRPVEIAADPPLQVGQNPREMAELILRVVLPQASPGS